MTSIGVRELRDQLSQYLRRVERTGESITITDHGRPIAELVPPQLPRHNHLDELMARGVVTPALDPSPEPLRWPDLHLPPGTAQQWIDEDRDER